MFFGGVPKNGVRGRAPLSGVPEETPGGGGQKNSEVFLNKKKAKTFFLFDHDSFVGTRKNLMMFTVDGHSELSERQDA